MTFHIFNFSVFCGGEIINVGEQKETKKERANVENGNSLIHHEETL